MGPQFKSRTRDPEPQKPTTTAQPKPANRSGSGLQDEKGIARDNEQSRRAGEVFKNWGNLGDQKPKNPTLPTRQAPQAPFQLPTRSERDEQIEKRLKKNFRDFKSIGENRSAPLDQSAIPDMGVLAVASGAAIPTDGATISL